MSNCCCNRETDPSGTWSYEDLIGAIVQIKSVSPGMKVEADKLCTIDDIIFRVSLDGKTITKIILKEFPEYYFTWKDLEIKKIIEKPKKVEHKDTTSIDVEEDDELSDIGLDDIIIN